MKMYDIVDLECKENVDILFNSEAVKKKIDTGKMYGEDIKEFYKCLETTDRRSWYRVISSICPSRVAVKIKSISRVDNPRFVRIDYKLTIFRNLLKGRINFTEAKLVPRVVYEYDSHLIRHFIAFDVMFKEEQEG